MRKPIRLLHQTIFYLFYSPVFAIFYLLCRMHKEKGREFWANVQINKFNVLVSCLWWLFLGVVILGVIMSVEY